MPGERFTQIGKKVSPQEVLLSHDQAERFRELLSLGEKKYIAADEETAVSYTSVYTSGVFSGFDLEMNRGVSSHAFYAKNIEGLEDDYWWGDVRLVRFGGNAPERKIYNMYKVEVSDGEVRSAVREVRVIRALGQGAFHESDSWPIAFDRKKFEVPMTPDDLEKIDQTMARISLRSTTTNGR